MHRDFQDRARLVVPCLPGVGSDGVFNLEQPSDASALTHFLEAVGVSVMNACSSLKSRIPIEPEVFWRADGDMQTDGVSRISRRVVSWHDYVIEQRFVMQLALPSTR